MREPRQRPPMMRSRFGALLREVFSRQFFSRKVRGIRCAELMNLPLLVYEPV